jgi:hypothetical protein
VCPHGRAGCVKTVVLIGIPKSAGQICPAGQHQNCSFLVPESSGCHEHQGGPMSTGSEVCGMVSSLKQVSKA